MYLHQDVPALAMEQVYGEYVEPIGEEVRTRAKLRMVIEEYKNKMMPPLWDSLLAIEQEFYFNAGPHRFVVIPDMVVKWRGAIYGVDHKHTTRISDNFFTKFRRDTQIDAQMLAIREAFGSCNGIYINGIVVRKGGPRSKLAEVEFLRDIAERTEDQLDRSRQYFKDWADKATEDKEHLENRTNCYDYNKACPYLGICNGTLSEEEIAERFQITPWEPRKKEVEKEEV